jgi:phage tail-like protein
MAFGTPRTFHKKFKFVFEIDDFSFFGFQKCSELSAEIAKIEYFEGGALLPNKSLGRVTVADLTIERAATADGDLWNWFSEGADMVSQTGLVEPNYKRDGDIVQLDRDGSELRRWTCTGLAVTKFVAGAWDNEADENVIESATLMLDTFDKTSGQ